MSTIPLSGLTTNDPHSSSTSITSVRAATGRSTTHVFQLRTKSWASQSRSGALRLGLLTTLDLQEGSGPLSGQVGRQSTRVSDLMQDMVLGMKCIGAFKSDLCLSHLNKLLGVGGEKAHLPQVIPLVHWVALLTLGVHPWTVFMQAAGWCRSFWGTELSKDSPHVSLHSQLIWRSAFSPPVFIRAPPPGRRLANIKPAPALGFDATSHDIVSMSYWPISASGGRGFPKNGCRKTSAGSHLI